MKMNEITCNDKLCDYKPDNDYDYCLLSILFIMAIYFINVI
jgi:hypothetical protein